MCEAVSSPISREQTCLLSTRGPLKETKLQSIEMIRIIPKCLHLKIGSTIRVPLLKRTTKQLVINTIYIIQDVRVYICMHN